MKRIININENKITKLTEKMIDLIEDAGMTYGEIRCSLALVEESVLETTIIDGIEERNKS